MPNLCDKESYDCNDLIKIVGILRSPEGCPWDRAQDHHTIRNNFLEEAYEAVEAIDLESSALLREELGDVLLQIALHSQMEAEQGHFDFNDVCTGICRKMIGRHPHIFGSEYAANAAEAAQSWEQQKRKEKGLYSLEDRLRQVSGALPALMRAQKLTPEQPHPDVSKIRMMVCSEIAWRMHFWRMKRMCKVGAGYCSLYASEWSDLEFLQRKRFPVSRTG